MANLTYVAASVNRYSNVSDCRDDGIVAFGSGHFVGIWDSSVSYFTASATEIDQVDRIKIQWEFKRRCLVIWEKFQF